MTASEKNWKQMKGQPVIKLFFLNKNTLYKNIEGQVEQNDMTKLKTK